MIRLFVAASLLTIASLAQSQPVSPNDPDYCDKIGRISENMVVGAELHRISIDELYKLNRANFAAGTASELMVANIDVAYEYYQMAKAENFRKSPADICRKDNAMIGSIAPHASQGN